MRGIESMQATSTEHRASTVTLARRASHRAAAAFPWIYIGPALAIELVFVLLPLVVAGYFSLRKFDFFVDGGFVGLANYVSVVADPVFRKSLLATTVFTVFATGFTFFSGFSLALLLERDSRWNVFVRAAVLVPYFISMLVGSLLLRWVFSEDAGLMELALAPMGLGGRSILGHPDTAMAALVANAIWRDSAFAMMLLLAGLKSIPPTLILAARVDGASYVFAFRKIILPLVRTPILITLTRLGLFYINILTFPLILTGGGPGGATQTVILWSFRVGFEDYALGRANAAAILVFVFNLLFVAGLFRMFRNKRSQP